MQRSLVDKAHPYKTMNLSAFSLQSLSKSELMRHSTFCLIALTPMLALNGSATGRQPDSIWKLAKIASGFNSCIKAKYLDCISCLFI